MIPKCERCGTAIQGRAALCVACFRDCWRPCLACKRKGRRLTYPRGRGGRCVWVTCPACLGEGGRLDWPPPAA